MTTLPNVRVSFFNCLSVMEVHRGTTFSIYFFFFRRCLITFIHQIDILTYSESSLNVSSLSVRSDTTESSPKVNGFVVF